MNFFFIIKFFKESIFWSCDFKNGLFEKEKFQVLDLQIWTFFQGVHFLVLQIHSLKKITFFFIFHLVSFFIVLWVHNT
jgi:hypothetical protein